jgi:O-antigen/teichoic acid export membrane protein
MFQQLKQLASDSLIYGLSGVVTKMIGILLVPIYTRIFLPDDYGIITLITTTFFLIGVLITFALDNSAARWFYDSSNVTEQKKTFAVYIWFQFATATVIAIIVIIVSYFFASHLIHKDNAPIYLILPAISLITNILPIVLINWYRVHRRPIATVVFTIASTLTTIGLTVLYVIKWHWGIIGVFAAITTSTILFSLLAMHQLWHWLSFKYFNKVRLKEMLRFAAPMVPAAIAYWLLNNTDAYFIAYFKDKSAVGLFSIGAMMASAIGLFTGAFQQAWGPFAFSIIHNDNAKDVYAKVFLIFGSFIAVVAATLMLFAPEVLMLFASPLYYDGAWVTGILGYNLVLISFSYIAIIGVSIKKTTLPYATAMLYASIATVLLDVLLIPKFGIEGSAIATVLAQIIVPVYIFYKGQKVYFIPYEFKKVAILLISFLVVAVCVRKVQFSSLYIQVGIKLAFLAIITIVHFKSLKKLFTKIKTLKKVEV